MLCQTMAYRDRGKAQPDRQSDIDQGLAPRVGTDQIEGLEAEGGEGGESAADPDHDEEPKIFGDWISAAVECKRAEVADDERADYVDENCANWKTDTDIEREHQLADCEAQETA